MNDEMREIAKRAVACHDWRWMPGMLCQPDEDGYAARVLHAGTTLATPQTADSYDRGGIITRGCIREDSLPDLNDPATIGCLLYLVREAWNDPSLAACRNMDERTWQIDPTVTDRTGATEAEALVCALEAARHDWTTTRRR